MSGKYEPITGFAVQMCHRERRVWPQFVWPKGERRALADVQQARQRAVWYRDEAKRSLGANASAMLEGWKVSQVESICVVKVENDRVVGPPIFEWSFGKATVDNLEPSRYSVFAAA
jgi:hypothetical protein